MQSTYEVTDEYVALVHKACLFAELCEYDAPIIVQGNFHFYNSPNCRSFIFEVDPATYKGNGVNTILKAFSDR